MIGNLGQFWRLTRELDLQGIRESFERSATIRVLAVDIREARRIARLLDPEASGEGIVPGTLAELASVRADATDAGDDAYVVAVDGTLDATARRALNDLTISGRPLLLLQRDGGAQVVVLGVPEDRVVRLAADEPDEVLRDRLVDALLRVAPESMLPLGRRYPGLRDAVASHLIRDASRVNAQFAALSSLPATIPLLGGLVGDMADMVVLTKNQVVLLFKLAGLYGRDLALGQRLFMEVAPVVGSAFLWRTTARALVGLLPGLVSALPKMLVAYSGTYVVGEMARSYYATGRPPSRSDVERLRQDSVRLARSTLERLRSLPSPRDPSDS